MIAVSSGDPSSVLLTPHPCCSLADAICSAARHFSVDLERDRLVSALGWPWLVCAVPSEPQVAHWPLYARDAFITEASKLLGVNVREIHPPEAARGLWGIAEFRQHFDLSYRPIIENALNNNQSVLAWRGWSGETAPTWGIITARCEGGVRLCGIPCTSVEGTSATPLDAPPVQVYVVESVDGANPSAARLAAHLEMTARRAIGGDLDEPFAVVTGRAAIDLWIGGVASRRIDVAACTAFLHSLRRSQASLRRVVARQIPSTALAQSADAISSILANDDEANPLPTLESLRDHFIDLYESLSA